MARLNERGKDILLLHAHHLTWMNLTKEYKAANGLRVTDITLTAISGASAVHAISGSLVTPSNRRCIVFQHVSSEGQETPPPRPSRARRRRICGAAMRGWYGPKEPALGDEDISVVSSPMRRSAVPHPRPRAARRSQGAAGPPRGAACPHDRRSRPSALPRQAVRLDRYGRNGAVDYGAAGGPLAVM